MVKGHGHTRAVIAPPIPWEMSFILGDFIQNLRSSLDYLVRELCVVCQKEPTKFNSFPICPNLKCFGNDVSKRAVDGLSVEMKAEIRALQPYMAGQDWERTNLWILHELCNMNKHRGIALARLEVHNETSVRREIAGLKIHKGNAGYGDAERTADMKVNDDLIALIAFEDGIVKGREMSTLTRHLIEYMESDVWPRFEKFF